MAMQYLHDNVHGAEGVSFFIKVFRETGCVAIVSEGFLVLLEPRGEVSSGLSDVCLITVGTGYFVHSDSKNLSGVVFLWESRFPIVFVVRNAILSSVFLKRLAM